MHLKWLCKLWKWLQKKHEINFHLAITSINYFYSMNGSTKKNQLYWTFWQIPFKHFFYTDKKWHGRWRWWRGKKYIECRMLVFFLVQNYTKIQFTNFQPFHLSIQARCFVEKKNRIIVRRINGWTNESK